jgi:spore coat protein U-like protein
MPRERAMRGAARALLLAALLATHGVAVAAACSVSTVPVAFGAYSPLAAIARESVGSIDVSCGDPAAGSVSYAIALSAGAGTYASRVMASGGSFLAYNLFRDSARNLVWGDGTGGSVVVSDSYIVATSPTVRSYTVYGRIAGGQRQAAVGTYGDRIIVTVAF